jgi:hypothetical protein
MKKPSERTLGKELNRLRSQIDAASDPILARISYAVETGIRWATEATTDWPMPTEMAQEEAELLHKELKATKTKP